MLLSAFCFTRSLDATVSFRWTLPGLITLPPGFIYICQCLTRLTEHSSRTHLHSKSV